MNHDATHCADYNKKNVPQILLSSAANGTFAKYRLSIAVSVGQFQRHG